MSYKIYTKNIELKPRETKVIKFPWGYFKRSPVVNLSSTSSVIITTQEVNKNYFVITNPISQRIIVSYAATLKRDQKIIRAYSDVDNDNIPDYIDDDDDNDGVLDVNDAFPLDPSESVDTDNDGTGDNADTDIDGDGFNNSDEISSGTDPYDDTDFPVTNASLYIGLKTLSQYISPDTLFSFYSGEMNDLSYPTLIDLQPDSSGNTQYQLITTASQPSDVAIEPQRVINDNQDIYNNTTPDSSIIRIDNLERNKNYTLFSIAEYDEFNLPQINATFKASSSSSEDPHTFLGNVDGSSYHNIINFVDTNVYDPQFWIHNISIDNSNQVTFTTDTQNNAEFAYTSMSFMMMHTKYFANSNGTDPSIEIAIQQADFDGTNDGSGSYGGYLGSWSYDLEQVNNETPIDSETNNNYTALVTTLNSDLNLENHARVAVSYISPRMRYRMHVKLLNGGDFDFKLALNVTSYMNYSDLDTYNNDYDINSNLNYYSIIPDDGQTGARTYYHYFTIREDGFVIWENNLTIND